MPDQPTDKVIVKLDDEKLKELFNGWIQPGDSLNIKSAKLTLDEVIPGDSGGDGTAVLSIVDIEFAPAAKETDPEEEGEAPYLGPGEQTPEGESAAMAMMTAKKDESGK